MTGTLAFFRAAIFLGITLALSPATIARAENYPAKPVRIVVPYPAGGGTDIATRIIAQKLTDAFKQSFYVDNRPGANGNLGTELIARANPDGYVIGMATPGPITVGRSLYPDLRYDPQKDLASVVLANESPIVLVTNPSLKASTLPELVKLAKAKPGKLTTAITATGSVAHLLTEMLKVSADVDILSVPYRGGGPAAIDLLSGQVDMTFAVLPLVIEYIKAGTMRAIAVASPKRTPLLPDVPTTAEAGYPDIVGSAWNGLVVPAGTPRPIIDALSKEMMKILQLPDVASQFEKLGMQAIGGTPDSFKDFQIAEARKWAEVIRAAKVTSP